MQRFRFIGSALARLPLQAVGARKRLAPPRRSFHPTIVVPLLLAGLVTVIELAKSGV